MPDQLQLRGGTTAQHASFTGASKEVTVDTTKKTLVVHDGSTAGGNPLLREDQSNLPTTAPTRGIYNASGSLAISTAGSGRLFINSSGVVTTDNSFTSGRLNVVNANTVSTFDRMLFLRSNSLSNAFLGLGNDSFYIASAPNAPIVFCTNSDGGASGTSVPTNERLRITSAGLVGVGVSSPSSVFHARLPGTSTATIATFDRSDGAVSSRIHYDGSDGRITFGTNTSHPLSFETNGTRAVTIDTSQRVGVGTTANPGSYNAQLAVSGGRLAVVYTASGIELDPQFGFVAGTVRAYDRITSSYKTLGLTGDTVAFGISDIEKARIDSSGRLLVGTSSYDGNARVVAQGNTSDNTTGALAIRLNNTRPSGGDVNIGALRFESLSNTTNNYHYASISCFSDGASGSDTDIPGRLVFSVTRDGSASPTEALRISNSGQATLFAGSSQDVLRVKTQSGAGTALALFVGAHSATGVTDGTGSIIIWSNGNVVNTNNSYGAISDLKLKENIVDAGSQWSDIKALQVRKYNFKEGQTHTQIGLIAQEVEQVSPGLVSESPDRDAEGNDLGTVTKSVNYSVLYMKAVKALQEAMERIETLEAKVAALESA